MGQHAHGREPVASTDAAGGPEPTTADTFAGRARDSVVESVIEAEHAVEAAITDVVGDAVDASATRRWTRGDSLRVVIAVSALVASAVIASQGYASWEARLFEAINATPGWLYPFFWPVMQLGNVWVAVVVAGCVALAIRRLPATVTLLAAPISAWIIAIVVKELIQRGRPIGLGLEVVTRGAEATGLGFISGHTTVAFALAAAVAAHLTRSWRLPLFVVATLVGVARIYVGAHMPLDVVGGIACGLLVGEVARLVEVEWSRHRRTAVR